MDMLTASNIILWIIVFTMALFIFALARQIGILYERIAPMGALMIDKGPNIGDQAPKMKVLDIIKNELFEFPEIGKKSALLFFMSPSCPVCKKLIPIIQKISIDESKWLEVMFASDGDISEHYSFINNNKSIGKYRYILSTDLGLKFQIGKLPYCVLIDEFGIIRAKGLVNSREQIESLFVAKEMGVASAQEYMKKQNLIPEKQL